MLRQRPGDGDDNAIMIVFYPQMSVTNTTVHRYYFSGCFIYFSHTL